MSHGEFHKLLSLAALVSFSILALIFAAATLVLNYHWTRYGIHENQIRRLRKIYFSVAFALGILMSGALAIIFIQ